MRATMSTVDATLFGNTKWIDFCGQSCATEVSVPVIKATATAASRPDNLATGYCITLLLVGSVETMLVHVIPVYRKPEPGVVTQLEAPALDLRTPGVEVGEHGIARRVRKCL